MELFLARLDLVMSSDTKSNRIVMLCMCGLGIANWIVGFRGYHFTEYIQSRDVYKYSYYCMFHYV
jgi:hypothetical protein